MLKLCLFSFPKREINNDKRIREVEKILVGSHLDYLITMSKSYSVCSWNFFKIIKRLPSLGFLVDLINFISSPYQETEYLAGYHEFTENDLNSDPNKTKNITTRKFSLQYAKLFE